MRWVTAFAALLAVGAVTTPTFARVASDAENHVQQHRSQMAAFQQLLESDPRAALDAAQGEVERARTLRPNDRRRGDALERLALAFVKLERYDAALAPAAEAVRIRKAARPVDHELVGLVQGVHALVLFALDRAAEADALLLDQLATYRKAYGRNDLRLAQKLESQAEMVQSGFGRPRLVVELLGEAAAIRQANPQASPGRLAATLQELAIRQVKLDQQVAADANLDRSQRILESLAAANPREEELRAGLGQTLVLRAGIAGVLADSDRARKLAAQARALRFDDRVLAAENEILVATVLSAILEAAEDYRGAIEQQRAVLETFGKNADLVASGAIDGGGIADTELWLARLLLQQPGDAALADARAAVESARTRLGDTSEVLFRLAEVERRSGREKEALDAYRKALTVRKENASEISVLFGTNRAPEQGREPARFGSATGDRLSFGQANVLVPGGPFSLDAWLKSRQDAPIPVGRATDASRLEIRSKSVVGKQGFAQAASAAMAPARLHPDAALVFIHGYNVQFDEAIKRGAQLVRDLNFDGPAFIFSWPSKGGTIGVFYYGLDQGTAANAVDALVEFLHEVRRATGAKSIHLIAHSMGNRVLLPALVKIANQRDADLRSRLGEVIFAAPAVPEREFIDSIGKLVKQGMNRFTLYASSFDRALLVGNVFDGRKFSLVVPVVLAGYVANGEPVVHPKMQSIDVSEARAGLLNMNHDVFATNPVMTEDIRQLLQTGERRPDKRLMQLLEPRPSAAKVRFWAYRRPDAGAGR